MSGLKTVKSLPETVVKPTVLLQLHASIKKKIVILTKNKIKISSDLTEKARLLIHYRLHKLRAKRFYEIMKTEETNVIRISFDMEQNQPLPKLRVSEVFYARQIWLYNLTFVLVEKNQKTSNTSVYTWTEYQSGRGSNEVTSALSHFLENVEKQFENVPENYLAPRSYEKNNTIIEPNEYHKVFATGATVNVLGTGWVISNFMDASKKALVKKFPFKMREQCVLICSKEHQTNIGVKNTYNGLPTTLKVTKSTEIFHEAYKNVPILPEENHVSQKKRQYVEKLLKFVTLSEHVTMFCQNALSDNVEGDQDNNIVVYD
ncbi:hypothetical protein PR048_015866 [Dryococelus australis]|uniref:Uncharacterized protein n=1 Tax=Dryococelus australis TaxID=614101 RepID=A0ABQ9HI44_9NEOP|nr:hypothetical protein PR048_015866 [Dryococelus australis]